MSWRMLTLHSIQLDDVELDILNKFGMKHAVSQRFFSSRKYFCYFLRPFDFATSFWLKQDAHWFLTKMPQDRACLALPVLFSGINSMIDFMGDRRKTRTTALLRRLTPWLWSIARGLPLCASATPGRDCRARVEQSAPRSASWRNRTQL